MLRLHSHGEQVLADWWAGDDITNADRYLVADVLLSVVDMKWYERWSWNDDLTDETVKIVEPRPGLKVVLRLWSEELGVFDLLAVVNEWRPQQPDRPTS